MDATTSFWNLFDALWDYERVGMPGWLKGSKAYKRCRAAAERANNKGRFDGTSAVVVVALREFVASWIDRAIRAS